MLMSFELPAVDTLGLYATKLVIRPDFSLDLASAISDGNRGTKGTWVSGYEQEMKQKNLTLGFPGDNATVEYTYNLTQWVNQTASPSDIVVRSSASCDVIKFDIVNDSQPFFIPHTKFSRSNQPRTAIKSGELRI